MGVNTREHRLYLDFQALLPNASYTLQHQYQYALFIHFIQKVVNSKFRIKEWSKIRNIRSVHFFEHVMKLFQQPRNKKIRLKKKL